MASTTYNKSKNNKPVKYTDFDPTKISTTPFEKKEGLDAQKIGYVKYNNESIKLLTPKFTQNHYGFPTGKYYDEKGNYKMPLYLDDTENKVFHDKLVELDNIFGSEKMKQLLFKNFASKYSYQPLVRFPVLKDEDEDEVITPEILKKREKIRTYPKFIKAKLSFDWKSKRLATKIFQKTDEYLQIPEDEIQTVENICKYVGYKSSVRLILTFSKIYVENQAKEHGGLKKYGFTLKIDQIETTPGEKYTKPEVSECGFYDDDDEIKQIINQTNEVAQTTISRNINQITTKNNLDDDSDEEEKVNDMINETKKVLNIKENLNDDSDGEIEEEKINNEELDESSDDDVPVKAKVVMKTDTKTKGKETKVKETPKSKTKMNNSSGSNI